MKTKPYGFIPKKRSRLRESGCFLFVTYAFTSLLPQSTRARIPSESTVDPELASTIVLFRASGISLSMFNAVNLVSSHITQDLKL